jgi:hypothetical protein
MAKYKELLISPRVVEAGKKRKCYHSRKHEIHKGDICLEVRDGMAWKGYCVECAAGMLEQARIGLHSVIDELASNTTV